MSASTSEGPRLLRALRDDGARPLVWGDGDLVFRSEARAIRRLLQAPDSLPRDTLRGAWFADRVLGEAAPLSAFFSVIGTMLVLSRASDAHTAYQFSRFAILPGVVPLIAYSSRKTLVDPALVGLEGAVLHAANSILLSFAIRVFRREEILTRWKEREASGDQPSSAHAPRLHGVC